PALVAIGTNFWEMSDSAANSATSTPSNASSPSAPSSISPSRNARRLPTDRSDANSFSVPVGKLERSRQRSISAPTAPVAPITATVLETVFSPTLAGRAAAVAWVTDRLLLCRRQGHQYPVRFPAGLAGGSSLQSQARSPSAPPGQWSSRNSAWKTSVAWAG